MDAPAAWAPADGMATVPTGRMGAAPRRPQPYACRTHTAVQPEPRPPGTGWPSPWREND
jgi:hypothetical protein